jgi:hypothetical protein
MAMRAVILGAILAFPALCLAAADEAMAPWLPLWSRDTGAGRAVVDNEAAAGQPPVIRIEHTGEQDWSLTRKERLAVEPGDIFKLRCRAKVQGAGSTTLCVTTHDAAGKVIEWVYGGRTARARDGWQTLESRFVIPADVAAVQPRVIGNGPATVWFDSFAISKEGNVKAMGRGALAAEVSVANKLLAVTLSTADATLAVEDKRAGKTWRQQRLRQDLVLTAAKAAAQRIEFEWMHVASGLEGRGAIALDGDLPEVAVTLSADGEMAAPLAFPQPFGADPPAYLVVPMNEGISYPVDDATIRPMHLVAYGGHGICMAFWGVTDGRAGQMAILETPDDASIRIARAGGRLVVAPEWESQKGRFGYERRLRYVFFGDGGHVAMCKRYREYARKIGLLKTLAEKRKEVPAVDLLIGAVNVWCWDKDAPAIVREMQEAGIERILWSNAQSPEALRALNAMPGVLTSRYDIYQDVMNPENFKLLRGTHPDWTTEAWPKDLMIGAGGDWVRGWEVEARDGTRIPCGVLCDKQAPPYAERRIPADLKDHPYRCRFIDTTTASPWRECYSPDHPMTRSESRRYKMDLLALVSGKFKLVTGCETGHDASVPFLHYFEGMLSLGPYRVPDSGRAMQKIFTDVPPDVAKFQLGHAYRLPLWELVYHDAVVAQWYWGDYNNKLPSLWDKRDLFNALYGTPPMFMFNRKLWGEQKDRFAQSYKATCPVARAVGYAEMTDHRFLTPDRSVQQTAFAGGVTVTVNFGDKPFRLPDGKEVAAGGCQVTGL